MFGMIYRAVRYNSLTCSKPDEYCRMPARVHFLMTINRFLKYLGRYWLRKNILVISFEMRTTKDYIASDLEDNEENGGPRTLNVDNSIVDVRQPD